LELHLVLSLILLRINMLNQTVVKNLPAMQETRVRSLGWEDALEEEFQEEGMASAKALRQVHGGVQEGEGCNSVPVSKRKTGVESEKVYRVTVLSCTLVS